MGILGNEGIKLELNSSQENHMCPFCGHHHITEATKYRQYQREARDPSPLQSEVGLARDLAKLPSQSHELVPRKESRMSWVYSNMWVYPHSKPS